ncbi:hypothetical protein WICPIJ_002325 [Wickerhamomyces pijperi]|uniref:SAC3/GANP/THP3 conserved domain-containing protein n=1 Tax=Wickerhamomyces pijperi TaxID=599730 RepID=A0A9P8QA09_WICPI|nr:hypothetical protein WICPIJ_002325 [Wickerhamomyces pijperi]
MSHNYNQVNPTSLNSRQGSNSYYNNNPPVGAGAPPNQPPPPPPPPQHQHQQQQPQGLPQSLTSFVEQCHQLASLRQFTPEQTTQMQTQLRELIQLADTQNKIWVNDWDSQSIPALVPGVALDLVCNTQVATTAKHVRANNNNGKIVKPKPKNNKSKDSSIVQMDTLTSKSAKRARAARFEQESMLRSSSPVSAASASMNTASPSPGHSSYHNDFDEEAYARNNKPLIGLSQTYLKNYFRLTSAPDPMNVRPLPILKQTLQILLDKYTKQGEKYTYICDQFKSMRQDLRVQHIEEEFTVIVYETHARIALENGDLGEFNQCQTMLTSLYSKPGIQGFNRLEFLSYKILYQLFTGNIDSIFQIRLGLTQRELTDDFIAMSLKLVKSMSQNLLNYHEFFRLYSLTLKTTKRLIDQFINSIRIKSLAIIVQGYKQLPLEFLLTELRFHSEPECLAFFAEYKLEQFMELKNDKVVFNTDKARPTVLGFSNKARKIDIKGQI